MTLAGIRFVNSRSENRHATEFAPCSRSGEQRTDQQTPSTRSRKRQAGRRRPRRSAAIPLVLDTMARRASVPAIVLADSLGYPALAGLGLFRRVLCCGESTRSPGWRTWPVARAAFSPARPGAVSFNLGWFPPTALALLDWLLGSIDDDAVLGGNGVVAPRPARLRQCYSHGPALGALYVDRPHWPGLVFLRLGDSAPGNGLSGYFPLPAPGRPAVSAAPTARRGHLAVSLVDFPNHARRGADQAAWRSLLAGLDLPVLPL